MHQFLPIASCPTAWHHQNKSGLILLAPCLQILVDIDEIPSQTSLLGAEQAHLPQPFFTGGMLQSFIHLCSPTPDLLQELHVLRSPELHKALLMWPHQG